MLRFKIKGPKPDSAYLRELAGASHRAVRILEYEVGLTKDESRAADILTASPLVLRPLEDAPLDTFVLLVGDSGYTSTPRRVEVCELSPLHGGDWRNHARDRFTDGGAPPIGWLPLPSCLKGTDQ